MQKSLFLLRHAKSDWNDPGLSDHDRPLNKRGLSAAPKVGELMRKQQLVPQLIISSTALRAKTTAELVASASGFSGPLQLDKRLYLAEPEGYLNVLTEVSDELDSVMLVGHNPGISELLLQLSTENIDMPTGGLAHLVLECTSLAQVDRRTPCRLAEFYRPREL